MADAGKKYGSTGKQLCPNFNQIFLSKKAYKEGEDTDFKFCESSQLNTNTTAIGLSDRILEVSRQ
jgi:hypothetical protein